MERRRQRVEAVTPKSETVTVVFDRDAAEGLLLLINEHLSKYTMKTQGLLVRALKPLEEVVFAEGHVGE